MQQALCRQGSICEESTAQQIAAQHGTVQCSTVCKSQLITTACSQYGLAPIGIAAAYSLGLQQAMCVASTYEARNVCRPETALQSSC
jgi:trans-2-enoyl-CoA reductase